MDTAGVCCPGHDPWLRKWQRTVELNHADSGRSDLHLLSGFACRALRDAPVLALVVFSFPI